MKWGMGIHYIYSIGSAGLFHIRRYDVVHVAFLENLPWLQQYKLTDSLPASFHFIHHTISHFSQTTVSSHI